MTAGDFAYVPPGDPHSYQCKSPQTQFFGVVSPGGWEGFFDMAGEPWEADCLPEPGHPFDFSKMGPAMGKYDVNPLDQTFCEPINGDATDRALPEAKASYVLQAGHGPRARLGGHLVTTLLTGALSDETIDMVTLEGGRGASLPRITHSTTHVTLFVLDGQVALSLGGEKHEIGPKDVVNIPAGTPYATEILSQSARWIAIGGNGNGVRVFAEAGDATDLTHFTSTFDGADLIAIEGVDAEVIG